MFSQHPHALRLLDRAGFASALNLRLRFLATRDVGFVVANAARAAGSIPAGAAARLATALHPREHARDLRGRGSVRGLRLRPRDPAREPGASFVKVLVRCCDVAARVVKRPTRVLREGPAAAARRRDGEPRRLGGRGRDGGGGRRRRRRRRRRVLRVCCRDVGGTAEGTADPAAAADVIRGFKRRALRVLRRLRHLPFRPLRGVVRGLPRAARDALERGRPFRERVRGERPRLGEAASEAASEAGAAVSAVSVVPLPSARGRVAQQRARPRRLPLVRVVRVRARGPDARDGDQSAERERDGVVARRRRKLRRRRRRRVVPRARARAAVSPRRLAVQIPRARARRKCALFRVVPLPPRALALALSRLLRGRRLPSLHLRAPRERLSARGSKVPAPREPVRFLPSGHLLRRALVVHPRGRQPERFLEHADVGAGVAEAHVSRGQPHRRDDLVVVLERTDARVVVREVVPGQRLRRRMRRWRRRIRRGTGASRASGEGTRERRRFERASDDGEVEDEDERAGTHRDPGPARGGRVDDRAASRPRRRDDARASRRRRRAARWRREARGSPQRRRRRARPHRDVTARSACQLRTR